MPKIPVTAKPHVFYIRPAPGWLELLYKEVSQIVANPFQKYKFEAKVTLMQSTVKLHRCDLRQGLEVFMRLTTAHDVEWVIDESKCSKWSEAEAIFKRLPIDEILPNRNIEVHVTPDVLDTFTSTSSSLREIFCKHTHLKHISEGANVRIKLELREERLRTSVSLAGDPLYKRGYKAKMSAVAPLPEHQAAACIRWTLELLKDEKVGTVFVPFAGSGTFGFESLVVLSGSGVGAFSRSFACEKFPSISIATMGYLRKKIKASLDSFLSPTVIYNDFNSEIVSVLKENVSAFPHANQCQIIEEDLFKLNPTFNTEDIVLVLLNPPYGDRLAQDTPMTAFYERTGKYFNELSKKNKILGCCICPDEYSWRAFLKGLQEAKAETHHFTHGGNEMRLVRWRTNG